MEKRTRPKIEKIAPVVAPTHEIIVFGLDGHGGLWKWDSAVKSEQWMQVCKP
jgi:hypothetical protein